MKVFVALILVLALALPAALAQPRAVEPIKLSLNFIPYGLHIGFFVAKEKGFYREAGMDVEILKGEGSGDALRRLGTGAVDFAMADMSAQIVGRTFENPAEAVQIFVKLHPEVNPERMRSEIKIVADLMLTPFAAREGLGHYEEKKVLLTRQHALKPRGVDPGTVSVKDIYSNEFLPKLFPRRNL